MPAIQCVRRFPRVLRDLRAGEHCLVLLYGAGTDGVAYEDLRTWVRPAMEKHLRRTLAKLVADDMAHQDAETYIILRPGEKYVEDNRLVEPA